ncbi:MAG: hypothetical protein DRI81_09025 [Chloroflexi bacterium]|nr:MAG: hypothetical protein DRI81_09025 [Chloroflexota bacterium]
MGVTVGVSVGVRVFVGPGMGVMVGVFVGVHWEGTVGPAGEGVAVGNSIVGIGVGSGKGLYTLSPTSV